MKKYTSCELIWNNKENYYKITLSYKDNINEGSQSGAKIYKVDNHLIHLSWGGGVPIAVYSDINEMLERLEKQYNVKPLIINKNGKYC